jgi:hypothetical protein
MNKVEIFQMAVHSGIEVYGLGRDRTKFVNYLERFAKLVAQHEREACAKICEETTASWTQHLYNEGCIDCAKAIRAKGQE